MALLIPWFLASQTERGKKKTSLLFEATELVGICYRASGNECCPVCVPVFPWKLQERRGRVSGFPAVSPGTCAFIHVLGFVLISLCSALSAV